jgi:hypothetical protein
MKVNLMNRLIYRSWLVAALLLAASPVFAVTTTTTYTVTVTSTPAISSVALSNTTLTTAANAGALVGAVSVVTNPIGGSYSGVITLGGTNAASFTLTNGGALPCNLMVGSTNLTNPSYSITLSATQ